MARINNQGAPLLGLAESIHISSLLAESSEPA